MRRGYQSQWAGQFGVAHEMTRRGYLVSFTTGTASTTDLLCESPAGIPFSVQVKTLSSKSYFLYQASLRKRNPGLFFVFALVPRSPVERPEYYVLDCGQFLALADEQDVLLKDIEKTRGKPFAPFAPGINYSTLARHDFLDAWKNLPA